MFIKLQKYIDLIIKNYLKKKSHPTWVTEVSHGGAQIEFHFFVSFKKKLVVFWKFHFFLLGLKVKFGPND